jgi:hypothetical protein
VQELLEGLTYSEYLGWLQYFEWMNGDQRPEEKDLLKEFKLK